jgi:hypothetical protein
MIMGFGGGGSGAGSSAAYERNLELQNEQMLRQEKEAAEAKKNAAEQDANRKRRAAQANLTAGGGLGEELEEDQILNQYTGVNKKVS